MLRMVGSILFTLFLPVWTLFIGTVGAVLMLFPQHITQWVGRIWARGVLVALRYLCGITYVIKGKENLPTTPCIITSKHQSAWDTVILLAYLPQMSYIYKKELGSIPVYGQYLPRMGMIPVDRDGKMSALRDMIRRVKHQLDKGFTVVIFPEGTRTPVGEALPYQAGISALYHECHVPVIPVALNSGLFWPKKGWKNPGCITLEFLPALAPDLTRRQFMDEMKNAIETKTAQLVDEVRSNKQ
ncbi:MAG: 1-acyl-sn-glycerol-3-phosphate acyltransferase [Alphaproteobacteria bacterium]|nr:1-acyl-sn-glycerol-3-phosphate acyltransferase [Alphaproteobacteria bacterium]